MVKVHPTQADLEAYGLEDPFCTMTVTTDAGVIQTLKIGKSFQLEGDDTVYYYGYYDGVDVAYSFTAETAPCISVQPRDISSGLVFTTYVWDIGKLTVTAKDRETMTFTGSGTSKDDYQVQLNGKEADPERFRKFYVFLLKTAAEDLCLNGETVQGDPLATITLERQDGKKTQTVSFYEAEGRKVYIEGMRLYVPPELCGHPVQEHGSVRYGSRFYSQLVRDPTDFAALLWYPGRCRMTGIETTRGQVL